MPIVLLNLNMNYYCFVPFAQWYSISHLKVLWVEKNLHINKISFTVKKIRPLSLLSLYPCISVFDLFAHTLHANKMS